jgi:hydroxymethylpyrimidine pyrophosphatase-like HAD family hydrolase
MSASIRWNDRVRFCISDLDETIADVYSPTAPAMVDELSALLHEGRALFIITGQGIDRVTSGLTHLISPELRQHIIAGVCSGSEVWGFTKAGELRNLPFYSMYDEVFTDQLKQIWREKTQQLLDRFGFITHPVESAHSFKAKYHNPLDIRYDDRGPQITLELLNAINLTDEQAASLPFEVPVSNGSRDLRFPVLDYAQHLFTEAGVPVTPRLAGTYAVDLAIAGVSKTTAITRVLNDSSILASIGLTSDNIADIDAFEVWGDKFSVINGGTDRHMSQALAPAVRSIDFRREDPAEFEPGYNIIVWDGQRHLHEGLLEYLQSRPR